MSYFVIALSFAAACTGADLRVWAMSRSAR